MRTPAAWARAFGRFWWEFLVGDTPELLVAVLVVIAIAFALHRDRAVGVVLVIASVVVFLSISTWRGRKRQPVRARTTGDGAKT